jgi:hypothetical protein
MIELRSAHGISPLSSPEDIALDAPPTEGIKYAGSKLKLLPHILRLAKKVNPRSIFDGFSGTTRVSQASPMILRCGRRRSLPVIY